MIAVAAPKGGSGKSTFALNVAAYLGAQLRSIGQQVAILDANVQQADLGKYLNTYSPGVDDVIENMDTFGPDTVGEYLVHRSGLNLSALLGPVFPPEDWRPFLYTPSLYTRIVGALRPHFDYIVIDTPSAEPSHPVFAEFALPVADYVLGVSPSRELGPLDAWMGAACASPADGGQGVDPARLGFVLTLQDGEAVPARSDLTEVCDQWRYLGAIPPPAGWRRSSSLAGIAVLDHPDELGPAFRSILGPVIGEDVLPDTPDPTRERPRRRLFSRRRRAC